MKFKPIPTTVPDMLTWGALEGSFTFVISRDLLGDEGYTASVKIVGATPFDGTRHDLGGFNEHKTLDDAIAACEKFLRGLH